MSVFRITVFVDNSEDVNKNSCIIVQVAPDGLSAKTCKRSDCMLLGRTIRDKLSSTLRPLGAFKECFGKYVMKNATNTPRQYLIRYESTPNLCCANIKLLFSVHDLLAYTKNHIKTGGKVGMKLGEVVHRSIHNRDVFIAHATLFAPVNRPLSPADAIRVL